MLKDKTAVYLALGSNLGDRYANLERGEDILASAGGFYLDRSSPTYESPAADLPDQPKFLNRVLALDTWYEPREVLAACQRVEQAMGRERTTDKGPRIIDVDILLFGQAVVNEADLVIPHAALARRPFFLQPLLDLLGDMTPPGASQRLSQMLAALAPYELTRVEAKPY